MRLQQDLAKVRSDEWIAHFNSSACETGWSCVALRAPGGNNDHIIPFEHMPFRDTELMQRCAYFRSVLSRFLCEKQAVRLMALAPGSHIKPHRDPGTSLPAGLTRLHIPIQTAEEVEFTIEHEVVHFSAAHTWYLDASCLHAVHNKSRLPRIHLVLDCVTNDWLRQLFRQAGFVPQPAPKYGDAMITDDNVHEVIASLRACGNATADQRARELLALANRFSSAGA